MSEESIVAGEPWRVGVMFSQTWVTAAVERTALHGTVLAIEEINARGGVLDRLIERSSRTLNRFLRATAPRPND
jgi:ABC-type branched-subunit amino acid transport system substrate-binding protein